MLAGFEWCTVDIQDPEQVLSAPHPIAHLATQPLASCGAHLQRAEVYKLLSKNYVEGGKSVFRFDYSQEFLLW